MAKHPIYEFTVTLDDYEPKVWRRFQVTQEMLVSRFCYIIKTMFEMKGRHLFNLKVPLPENLSLDVKEPQVEDFDDIDDFFDKQLEFSRTYYPAFEIKNPSLGLDPSTCDATRTKLRKILNKIGDKLIFNYDFGDNWTINIKLENIFVDPELNARLLPRVLEGEGFGIIEDCSGTSGLERIAKYLRGDIPRSKLKNDDTSASFYVPIL